MSVSRRSFIRIAGSSAVIAAAGAGTFAFTRTPTTALVPWSAAGAYADPRMRALSYAILAPNPHNRQPWLVDLGTEGEITLHCDLERLLPETDPFNRQIVIGLGCFLELLRMAAAEDGYDAAITPFPDGEPGGTVDARPVARIAFRKSDGAAPDPLFRHVLDRRSNKEPYDATRPVSDAALAGLRAAAGLDKGVGTTNAADRVAGFRDLTWRAFEIEATTPRTYLESVRLARIGKAEIEANPDGIDLGGVFLETLGLLGVLNRQAMADPRSDAYRQGMDMYRDITGTAMAYVLVVTDTNTRRDQLDAGRAWVRMNLKAAELGIGIHPLSQALQEYPEMEALYDELHTTLGAGNARVQMLGRLGYGPEADPSPRWPLEARIRKV